MKVAVYGTLRKGFGNNRLLESSKFVGEGKIDNNWSLFVPVVDDKMVSFPYAVEETSDEGFVCEVYEIDDKTLKSLDYLEGYPSFYDRKEVEVELNGEKVTASMYFVKKTQVPSNAVKKNEYKRKY